MLFNSWEFILFLAVVYGLYLRLPHRSQNRMLLVASYFFYACWDWRFLSLIFLSTVVDYWAAIKISEATDKRIKNRWLAVSVVFNLGLLFVFKYLGFFIENMAALLKTLGLNPEPFYLNIILPMGISFYTFQTMSYSLDVHRGVLKPTRSFLDFALFVSFFPQLVAGPIERASRLLPQVLKPRTVSLEKFYEGCFLIGWGLFQKVVIADNLAKVVDPIFAGPTPQNTWVVLAALYAFTYQIYCDFAGYSHIARGLGKIMGFEIMLNFNLPFFATNIQDYWNRWHISLSSWLRDYLYFPLIGWLRALKGQMRVYVALMVTMVLIGFWHGAAWTFGVFGVYYGMLLVLYTIIRRYCSSWIRPKQRWAAGLWTAVRIVFLFHLVVVGMLIFRSQSVGQVFEMLGVVVFGGRGLDGQVVAVWSKTLFFCGMIFLVQLWQYLSKDLMVMYRSPMPVRFGLYLAGMVLMLIIGRVDGSEFIYFQF